MSLLDSPVSGGQKGAVEGTLTFFVGGEPAALGRGVADLQRDYGLRIVGGCCGTDAEHLTCIASACR